MSLLSKPVVMRKMMRYRDKARQREYALQLVELNYDNRCNFKCEHCFSRNLIQGERKLSLADVTRLADQAHELGAWQWHLQGGEPLLWGDLFDVIQAIGPDRYHIMITTNGSLMTETMASDLHRAGVDKISVSLDSFVPETHDRFRAFPHAHERAVNALALAKAAGMQANVNTVVTHQNVHSQDLQDIIAFAEGNGYTLLLVVAASAGAWAGRTDMLITEEDAGYLLELKKRHDGIHRDLYPIFDFEWGCRTMNGLVYVTSDGELLPCPFIHISMGNVLDEPLADILRQGWRVRYFRDYSPRCLVGEDRAFIQRFMGLSVGRKGPVPFAEAFKEEDLYEE
ncbi:MAG: radical SAM/SPASM domain-containing protein [Desulfovibrionaceae bacterium]